MKIFLIGMMGAGKTTHGKKLAGMLGYGFIDLDQVIEQFEGRSVNSIFETEGEDYFREVESGQLRLLESKEDQIISVGGGTPCFMGNIEWMNRNGVTVYLELSPDEITSRLINSKNDRPLLKNKSAAEIREYITDLLEKREIYYNKASVVVEGKNLKTSVLRKKIEERI